MLQSEGFLQRRKEEWFLPPGMALRHCKRLPKLVFVAITRIALPGITTASGARGPMNLMSGSNPATYVTKPKTQDTRGTNTKTRQPG